MKENYLFDDNFSSPADVECFCNNQKEAEKIFAEKGIFGEVNIEAVSDTKHKHYLFWICRRMFKVVASFPLFKCRKKLSELTYNKIFIINKSYMISYRDYFYHVIRTNGKQYRVRRLKVFNNQDTVEKYCGIKGLKPESIHMQHITRISDNKKITVCWAISCPNELGGYTITLLPVCWKDRVILRDYNLNSLNFEDVRLGEIISVNDILYTYKKDEANKYYIEKSCLQLVLKA